MSRSSLTLISILLVCLIAMATFFGIYKIRESRLRDSSEQYALAFSETMFTTWNVDYFLDNCSREFCNKLPREAFVLMINNMKRIGNVQEIKSVGGVLRDSFIFNNGNVIATYTMASSFENADADITVELVQEESGWKVSNFYLSSDFLAD